MIPIGKCHCAVLGVTYQTAPVSLRDRLSRALQEQEMAQKSLCEIPGVEESIILSTCNRTEIYVAALSPEVLLDPLLAWWAEKAGASIDELVPHCFYFVHGEAVSHLYRVAASAESLVLGENQILAQVKQAFERAKNVRSSGRLLNHLFQSALSLGKLVREKTSIGKGSVSISHAAFELCRSVLGEKNRAMLRVGILGCGEMGRLSSLVFSSEGVRDFSFFNRTRSKSELFAEEFGGKAFDLISLAKEFPRLDILIACASSPELLLKVEEVCEFSSKTLVVDLASPRVIDPSFENHPSVLLFSIDDLNRVVEKNRRARQAALQEVLLLAEEATGNFREWFSSKELSPLLVQMQTYHQLVGEMLLEKWKKKVDDKVYESLAKFESEFRKKLLHVPFEALRQLCSAGMGLESELVLGKLFSLEDLRAHFGLSTGEELSEDA